MTISDTRFDVDSFMAELLADPASMIERVLQQLFGAHDFDELIASAFGGQFRSLQDGGGQEEPLVLDSAHDHVSAAGIEQMVDRNSLLAAALGACDCWGVDDVCPFCEGFGATGWTRPDRALFAEFVYPAVRALATARSGRLRPRSAQPDNHRKDDWR